MSGLPPGWASTTLGEISRAEYGKGLRAADRDAEGAVPVYGSAGIVGRHSQALVSEPVIIVGRKGNAGACFVSIEPSWPIDTTYFLRVPTGIDPRFLGHQLAIAALGALDSSTAIPSLLRPDLEGQQLAVAPLNEQQRIVAAIEEHLSRLDAAETTLRAGRQRLGALERGVRSLSVAHGEARKVGDLLRGIEAGKSFRCHGRPASEDEWGVVKVSAMTWGSFDQEENKAVISDERVEPRWEIKEGDLLLSRANTTELVGATVLVHKTRPRLLLSDKSMRLLVRDEVDKAWLQMALSAPESRRQMSAVATGTKDSMRNISQDKVKAVRIRVPSLEEQQRVLATVEEQLSAIDALRTATDRTQRRSRSLRRAVLDRAFRGELVPQDLTDEPASVLLERIRAEREATASTRRPSRRRATISGS